MNNIIKILIFICVVIVIFFGYQRAYGAAHLIVNMHPIEEEVLVVTNLFPKTITANFEITNKDKLVYISRIGTFVGIKLIKQEGTKRIELTNLIITNTTIDLTTYNLKTNIAYELCIKPYYNFGDLGILNVSTMSEYNFSSYTIKNLTINPPQSLTFIFLKGE